MQAEKSTIALHKFHPDLKDVWGDLERTIKVVEPKKAEQPPNLKVQLLPFQLESLSWFKEQESGPWSGGMLAVSIILLLFPFHRVMNICIQQDEMGYV